MVAALEVEAYAVGHQERFSTVLDHAAARTWHDAYLNSRLTAVGLLLAFLLIGLLALGVVRVGEWVDHRTTRRARIAAERRRPPAWRITAIRHAPDLYVTRRLAPHRAELADLTQLAQDLFADDADEPSEH
jgi:hypothetical protein